MVHPMNRKDWSLYLVATQHHPGDEMVIRKVKAPDVRSVEEMSRRLCCVANCTELNWYEVSEECVDKATGELTTVIHVGDVSKPWPKTPKGIVRDPNIYSPLPKDMQAAQSFERPLLPRELPAPPEHIRLGMPPVQNRTILNNSERVEDVITDVRTIRAQVAAKRQRREANETTVVTPTVVRHTSTFKPMQRLIKKKAA